MSDTDIIARLRLSSKAFSSEFNSALDAVDKKAKTTGEQISAAFGQQAGAALSDITARVPVFGSALAGLTGPMALAGVGVGALGAAFAYGVKELEQYEAATRQFSAVLAATGNKTGYTRDQLLDYAEALEGAIAIPAEEILKAQQVLATFDGLAGSTFKKATEAAADMAATFGGDLSSNSEKLGTVLQNLAEGNVEGLRKGFKFLGTATTETIENLAKAGKTAEAQEALFAALEARIGGTAEANAGGLAGAFFRLKDAIGDTLRGQAAASGYLGVLTSGVNALADAIDRVTRDPNSIVGGAKQFAGDPINPGQMAEDAAARSAAAEAKRTGDAARAASAALEANKKAAKDAASEAERAAKAHDALRKSLDAELAAMESQAAAASASKEDREFEAKAFDVLAKYSAIVTANDRERAIHATAIRLDVEATTASLKGDQSGAADLEAWLKKGAANDAAAQRTAAAAMETNKRAQAEQFRYLSDSFYEAFNGRASSIWGNFKALGARTIAELAAQFTLTGTISLAGTAAGGLLSSLGGGTAGGLAGTASSAAGLAGLGGLGGLLGSAGGSLAIGGAGVGTLSVGGSVIGGTSGIVSTAGSGALGSLGGAGAALSAAAPYLAAAAAAGLVLSQVLKKDDWGDANLATTSSGVSITGQRTHGSGRAATDASLASAVSSSLSSYAAQLGGTLASGIALGSIGTNKSSYYYNPTGGGFKGAGAQVYKTAEEAAAAAVADAIAKGAIKGLDATAQKILAGGGDLTAKIAKAGALQTALTELDKVLDPTGAAFKALYDQFAELRDMMLEAGASSEQLAKASAAYDKQLSALQASTGGAGGALSEFLASLNIGSGSPLALGAQQAAARAAYEKAAGSIGTAGFDSAAFTAAGRSYIDVQRQIDGGTASFFDVFNRIQSDTSRALAASSAGATAAENPFAAKTAEATTSTAQSAAQLLEATLATNDLLMQILANSGLSNSGGSPAAELGYRRAAA